MAPALLSMGDMDSAESVPPRLDGEETMDTPPQALPLAEIVRRYPNQGVLVEETAWDARAYPTAGIVHAASVSRGDLREPLRRCHLDRSVTTFLFYTGDPIPTDLTVVLWNAVAIVSQAGGARAECCSSPVSCRSRKPESVETLDIYPDYDHPTTGPFPESIHRLC